MHLACTFTGGAAACTFALSSFESPLCTLLLHLLTRLETCQSYKTRLSLNTARCGMHLSHFSVNFWCPPLDTAARLDTSSFVLRFTPWYATCCCFETKFVATRSQSVPRLCSTHSRCKSLFFGDCQISSAYPLIPVGFLTEIHTTNKARQIDAGGEHNRRHEQTEHAAEQQDSQQRVLNKTIQMVQCIIPAQRLI